MTKHAFVLARRSPERLRVRSPERLALLLSALLLAAAGLVAQTVDLQQTIPFDSVVKTATLPNGLKYFIRQNSRPAKRLSLRLAVKAGSLFEADDQQGLAHLIEHMAFNGSAHVKPGELVSYFESIGARLGPHVNAYTSFDETVYMLDVPSDNKEVVQKAVTALADFAGGKIIPASMGSRCELHPLRWRTKGSTREWRKTRERILVRDGYRCTVHVRPGERCEGTGLLEVHHIYGRDALVLVDNQLRTVCRKHNPRGG